MNKIMIALLLLCLLSACSSQSAPLAQAEKSEGTQGQAVTMTEESVWPENSYTDGLPVPNGTVCWTMLDTEHENCSISLTMSEDDYTAYLECLEQEGFSTIEAVSEEVRGQNYVSNGMLLSNSNKWLSIVYIPNRLAICISFVY